MTKSQIKQLEKLHHRLQELARISKFVPPKLEKRIRKWFKKKFEIFLDGEDLQYHLKRLARYFEIKNYADKEDIEDLIIEDGLMIDIYWPVSMQEKSGLSVKKFVEMFEQEVLNPTGYQIVDYDHTRLEATLYITNLKARTKAIKKPKFLYHFAHVKHEKAILKKGLLPKDGPSDFSHKMYKSRIYLIASSPKSWDVHTLNMLSDSMEDNFVVFRIDTRKFNRFNVFEDFEARGGEFVWTPTHIPARALKVIYRWKSELEFLSAIKDFEDWVNSHHDKLY